MDAMEPMYLDLAAAYVRGIRPDLDGADDEAIVARARDAGLKLYPFKQSRELPRVRAVLGALQGIQPQSLLDIGSGRGVFLWPLLETFDQLAVTAIDASDKRVAILDAVARGGVDRLTAATMDATALTFDDGAFDVVTVLEVLEHLEDPSHAACEAARVARRFVVASVPSKEDDNPEHIQLFDKRSLTRLFEQAGARSVNITYVLNHMICVATL
jgi:2-polyprenyl-3-methyl-5-hydroxy-6-metoxy-1,4-benzoquinol methylase